MSFRAWRAVVDHSRHKGDEFVLLLMIADCINQETGEAFPSVTYLANKARMGRRRTFRALKRLRAGGELEVTSARGGGSGKSNRYRLNPLPLIGDTHVTNNSDTSVTNAERPNSDKSSIRIVTERARNSDNGGHTILSYPIQKPGGAAAVASAHPRRVRRKSKPKSPKNAQPWPDDFTLSPSMREFAASRGIDADLQFDLFHNYALDHPDKPHADWPAAWRTWVLHEKQYAAERTARNGASRPSPPARKLQTAAELESARAARREH